MSSYLGPNGLMLYLDAGNINSYPGSGNLWSDVSSTKSTTILTNVSYTNSHLLFNSNLPSDGDTGVSVGDNTTTLTLAAWVYPTTVNYAACWMSKDDGPSLTVNRSWYFGANDANTFKAATFANGRQDIIMSYTINTWNYVCLTYDGSYIYLYCNGVQSPPTAQTGLIAQHNWNVRIGNIGGNSYYYDGYIDICQIYHKTLSPTEILQNYNATKSRYGL